MCCHCSQSVFALQFQTQSKLSVLSQSSGSKVSSSQSSTDMGKSQHKQKAAAKSAVSGSKQKVSAMLSKSDSESSSESSEGRFILRLETQIVKHHHSFPMCSVCWGLVGHRCSKSLSVFRHFWSRLSSGFKQYFITFTMSILVLFLGVLYLYCLCLVERVIRITLSCVCLSVCSVVTPLGSVTRLWSSHFTIKASRRNMCSWSPLVFTGCPIKE